MIGRVDGRMAPWLSEGGGARAGDNGEEQMRGGNQCARV